MAGSSETNETTQVLSQYKNADITKRDIMNALSQYKDLRPELEKYYFEDGTTKNLLNLNGTIPVKYEGDEYNIPIIVWLLDTHPYNSPMVYVKPTRNMYIKANRNVHSDGNVDIPYLRVWRYPHSDLLGLIKVLVKVFGEEPPLYSSSSASQQTHQVQSEHLSSASEERSNIVSPPVTASGTTTTPGLEDNEKRLMRFLKLVRLSRHALQIFFDDVFPGHELQNMLADKKYLIAHGEKRVEKDQIPVLYPEGGKPANSCEFGISTMYNLLRNYAENINPPSNGWGNKPNNGHKQNGDDVERIRIHRNYLSQIIEFEHEMDDFNLKWEDLKQAIIRLSKGTLRGEVAALSA
ncbi:uncharacterized protein LOC134241098 [Saccostrea cucullata]|uniref:uncharacterized protein LOC134241098 n=1 Tax=Saccostrea cuccullata TaxID=36930 RepID=UPI002ED2B08B